MHWWNVSKKSTNPFLCFLVFLNTRNSSKYGQNDILKSYAIQIMCDFWIFGESFTIKEEWCREARIQCNKILPPGSDWDSDSDECKRMEKLYKGGKITRGRGNKEELIGRAPSLGVGWVYQKVHCRGWPFCVVATFFWKFRHTAWAVGTSVAAHQLPEVPELSQWEVVTTQNGHPVLADSGFGPYVWFTGRISVSFQVRWTRCRCLRRGTSSRRRRPSSGCAAAARTPGSSAPAPTSCCPSDRPSPGSSRRTLPSSSPSGPQRNRR